jgi:Zn-dependent protease with chaperone function
MATYLNLLSGASFFLAAIPGSISWRLRFQKDACLLDSRIKKFIESKIKEFALKLGISKEVELREIKDLMGYAQAQGNAIWPGRIGIVIDSELANKASQDQLEFLIGHELSHIKANDAIWMATAASSVGVITTLAMSILFPSSAAYFSKLVICTFMVSSPAAAIGLTASSIAFVFFSKRREECADRLGFAICSKAAKQAAPQFFEKIIKEHLEDRDNQKDTYWLRLLTRILITKEGNDRLDLFHPSLTKRVEYLKQLNEKES